MGGGGAVRARFFAIFPLLGFVSDFLVVHLGGGGIYQCAAGNWVYIGCYVFRPAFGCCAHAKVWCTTLTMAEKKYFNQLSGSGST